MLVLALVPAVLVAAYLWNLLLPLTVAPSTDLGRMYLEAAALLLPLVVLPPAVVAALRPVLPRDAGHAALWIGWLLLGLAAVPVLALTLPQSGPPWRAAVSFRTATALWGTHLVAAAVLATTSVALTTRAARTRTRWIVSTAIGVVPFAFVVLLWATDPRLA